MKRFIIPLFYVIAISFFISSCGHSWTNEEKADFLKKCEAIDSLQGFSIQLSGFTADEVDSILIRERKNSIVTDSFYVAAIDVKEDFICYINKTIHTKSSYEILIPGQAKHVLSNITMGMVPQFTNSGEGWGCGMVGYWVDGFSYDDKRFEGMKIKNEQSVIPAIDTTYLEYKEQFKFSETYPFAQAASIEVLAYPDRSAWDKTEDKDGNYLNNDIIGNGKVTIDPAKIKERVKLSRFNQKRLFQTLYNINCKVAQMAPCFMPRHAIIFYDKNDKAYAFIEICFGCAAIQTSENIKLNVICYDNLSEVAKVFKNAGIRYELPN